MFRRYLGLAIISAVVLASCSRDPQVLKQKYYNSALALLKKGDINRATLQLKNAVRVDPQFAEAANVLAEIDVRQGQYGEAYGLLQQALKAKPDYLPAHKGLSLLYRLSGKLPDAQAELEKILQQTPDDTDALLGLAGVQQDQKKFTDAEGSLSRILEIQPNQVQALLGLAALKEKMGDLSSAERYLNLAVERNSRSAGVYLTLIRFYITQRRPADAESLFAQALRVNNNNVAILEAQDGYYEGLGKLTEAEAAVRKIQASHAGDSQYRDTLADFYVRTGNWIKAQKELERLIAERKDPTELHKLVEVHLMQNDAQGAEALNNGLLQKNPKDAVAHLAKGRLALSAGETEQALLEFNLARHYMPDHAALYYWYAQAYRRRHSYQLVEESLETALKYDPSLRDARLELAQLEVQSGEANVAIGHAQQLLQVNPADVDAMLVYSQALIFQQNLDAAGRILQQVVGIAPGSGEAHRQLALLAFQKKNLPAVQKELQQAWSLEPGSKAILEPLLLSYVLQKQTGEANSLLQRELQKRANDPLLYQEMAQVYLVLGKRNEAISALQKASALAPGDPEIALALADLYVSAGQGQPALSLLQDLAKAQARDADVLFRAGILFEKLQHWAEAQQAYENAVQLDRDNALAKNNLAWLLASHGGNIDVALSLAEQAKEKLPDDPQVTDTLGWIYYRKQVYRTALQFMKLCAEQEPKNAMFAFHLGMTYLKLGENDEARRALRKALALDPRLAEHADAQEALAAL